MFYLVPVVEKLSCPQIVTAVPGVHANSPNAHSGPQRGIGVSAVACLHYP